MFLSFLAKQQKDIRNESDKYLQQFYLPIWGLTFAIYKQEYMFVKYKHSILE